MKRQFSFIVVLLLTMVVTVLPINPARQALAASYTNSTPADVDGGAATRSVNVTETTPIADVNISISFTKTSGDCVEPDDGYAYHNEIEFVLVSPSGTEVLLVNGDDEGEEEPPSEQANVAGAEVKSPRGTRAPSTYSGGGDIGDVTIYLDDEAGLAVGGVDPISGNFIPVGSLAAFDGQNPAGTWTLRIVDTAGADYLCFYSFTLYFGDTILAQCGNFGDARVNNTDKDCIPPFVVYCVGTTTEIYDIDYTTSRGTLLVSWTKAEVDEIGIPEGGPVSLGKFGDLSFWRLATGEFQGNGLTPEGKPYIFVWNGCPVSHYYHLAN